MKTGGLLRLLLTLPAWLTASAALAQEPHEEQTPEEVRERRRRLGQLSLEELMNVRVSLVARREQKLMTAPSAVTVITSEELRRSGVTSVAEALRRVPGFQVARIDSNKWAITARGFNDLSASKLLVLIDGRSVYDPLFSGVFWDVQDLMLEDIDRIEVVRGPGGTLWGANAVNGVINIITKSAEDTQGGLVSAGGGTEERGFTSVRYGGKLDEKSWYRVYGKFFSRDSSQHGEDGWLQGRMGFRVDSKPTSAVRLTMQGDYYQGEFDSLLGIPSLAAPFMNVFDDTSEVAGGNLLMRAEQTFESGGQVAMQIYYDRTERAIPSVIEVDRDTADFEFQHRFSAPARQQITWGGGFRWTSDDVENTFVLNLDPERRSDTLGSTFVQDEIEVIEDRLTLTVGSKFEYNSYTGFEYQPSARLSWIPHERHSAWAAVSKAVRTPSRIEDDIRVNRRVLGGAPLTLISFFGDPDVKAEDVIALEMGYRVLPADTLSADIALFYNEYDDLMSTEPGLPFAEAVPPPAHTVVPLLADNLYEGSTYGFELSANWDILEDWRLYGAYSFGRMNLRRTGDSLDLTTEGREGDGPRHQVYLQSSLNLPHDVELDVIGRYVDVLSNQNVDSYIEADVRLGWRPLDTLHVAVIGQNLVHDEHREYTRAFPFVPSEIERGIYLVVTLRF